MLFKIEALKDRDGELAKKRRDVADREGLETDPKYYKGINNTLINMPHLKNFTTYSGAAEEIQKRIPHNYFSEFGSITLGEKIAGGITIGCGVAIALILELQSNMVELIPNDWVNE